MLNKPTVGAIVFYVKDLERTATFYEDILGLNIEWLPGHDGPFVMAQAVNTRLIFFKGEEKPGKTPIVVFAVNEGIDNLVEDLAKKGVQIVLPVSDAPGGGWTSDFLDPDQYILSFYQPPGTSRRIK
jgi:predicted enzyme related to lactoylglutathione lyase